ncbi:TolC family protein [Rubrivivax rivuli]|uniref:TolC family protein n=1 Tax=Rubrivivax rivuli TaxID=1862385 RepID=A0A437RAR0_9BURK|nr:TolC family protein [Rubrivivax rivuli]RVU43871.1 TolC family protein [Rubrivivax rivuli]
MKVLPRLAACALAGGLAGLPAWAQPAASPAAPSAATPATAQAHASLRTALDAAWLRAVASREAEGQRSRADAERVAAGSLWAGAPALELSHRNDRLHGRAGSRETEMGLAVPLWLPGQRGARTGVADAGLAQARLAEQVARWRLAGEVREAAWQVAGQQAELEQAEALATSLRQLAEDVVRRVQAGDLAPADSLAAQAEALAATAARADARQRLQAAHARWRLLTGLTAPPAPEDAAEPEPALHDAAGAAPHPEWQLASQTTELARQRVALLRHSRRDAPELTVAVRQDTPGRGEAARGSVSVGLRLPFGTDERNRPLEAAALAELDIAQTHEQRLRERLDSDIAMAREAQRSAQAQLDAEAQRARLLRERAALLDKSFRAGETPLPELLRALAAAAQADSTAARQTAALGLARARLQQALGRLP